MRTNQLVLIDSTNPDFRIDDRTRQMGREGVAAARAVLMQSVVRHAESAASDRKAA